jgi:hypothetical protein
MDWATSWAILSQARLVALSLSQANPVQVATNLVKRLS